MRHLIAAMIGAVLGAAPASAADVAKIDWAAVPASSVTLFYPGQSSYQWLRSGSHAGAKMTQDGAACTACHRNQEKGLGEKIVGGGPLEPAAVKGKNGSIELRVQAAYDAKNAYLRFQWKTLNPYPGSEHQYLRFDGKHWLIYGRPKLDKSVQQGREPGLYEDRLSIMFDDAKVPLFAEQGCWLTCHTGQRDMPGEASKEQARGNTLLKALGKDDLRKYLPSTRSNADDWKSAKSLDEIGKIKSAGAFVDLIQWRAHRSAPVGMGDDGYVLEYRNFDAGRNAFGSNADPKTGAPKLMWDAKKVGYRSITQAQLRKGDHFLIRERNAVAFDPNAGWKAGDMIPYYMTSRADASGSAADNNALSSWKDGIWTVVMVRPLGLANADDKPLKEGGVYNVGFAVHDDNITTRGHHVSFVKTLGIGAKAEIQAVKLP